MATQIWAAQRRPSSGTAQVDARRSVGAQAGEAQSCQLSQTGGGLVRERKGTACAAAVHIQEKFRAEHMRDAGANIQSAEVAQAGDRVRIRSIVDDELVGPAEEDGVLLGESLVDPALVVVGAVHQWLPENLVVVRICLQVRLVEVRLDIVWIWVSICSWGIVLLVNCCRVYPLPDAFTVVVVGSKIAALAPKPGLLESLFNSAGVGTT